MSFWAICVGLLGLLAWMLYRQMTWRVVNPTRVWQLPVVLALTGFAVSFPGTSG